MVHRLVQANESDPGRSVSLWFLLITTLFIACLIAANIVAVKLIQVFGLLLPAAIIIFPVSYILGDVLTEVYGYHHARRVIWLGFLCNLIVVVAIEVARILPPASFWDGQQAFERILGYTPRLLIASLLAYLVGEFANAFVLAKMKIATRGRWLWRAFPQVGVAVLRPPSVYRYLRHRLVPNEGVQGGEHDGHDGTGR